MRKLLLFFAMLCVSIGAWADVPNGATAFGSNGSYWKVEDGVATVYVAQAGDVNSSLYSSSNWSVPTDLENATKVVFETAEGVALSADDTDVLWAFKKAKILDFSGATISGHFQLPETNPVVIATSGADITTFYNTASGNGGYWPQRWQALATNDGSVLNLYMVADANRSDLISSDLISTATDVVIQSVYDNAVVNVNTNLKNSIASIPKQSDGETIRNSLKIVNGKITDGDWTYNCTHVSNLDFSGINADGNDIIFNTGYANNLNTVNLSGAKNLKNVNLSTETGLTVLDLTDATVKSDATSTITLPDPVPTGLAIHVTDPDNLAFTFTPSATGHISGPVAPAYTFSSSWMVFHDKNANNDGDTFRYWYEDQTQANNVVALGISDGNRLSDILSDNEAALDFTNKTYTIAKLVGPVTAADLNSLGGINATVLDLREATSGDAEKTIDELLKSVFKESNPLNSNVKFVILPDNCSRELLVNETDLAGLARSVYSVGAFATTNDGHNLTTCSFVSGAVQPLVAVALSSASNSWSKTVGGQTRKIYTSSISDFKVVKISGLINAYDLSKSNQKVDENGHLVRTDTYEEVSKQWNSQWIGGDYTVYGPFCSTYNLTEIDLKGARFELKVDVNGDVADRYYTEDMTLAALGLIAQATYKVVIPEHPTVKEIPADFMNCSTSIRAIGIPSNILAIRTRAFYTIDYVWTTANQGTYGTDDPEGDNTKLDNGTYLNDGTFVSATIYDDATGKFIENPDWQNSYYTADYSSIKGGGTYTFGSNIKLIETAAFANTTPHVRDVYVLNTVAPECHVDAFNTQMYTGNGGYQGVASGESIITREAYFNNGTWITMLHYPRQTTDPNIQRYTDPTREYSIATGMRDGKGATIYFPNQSEYIRAYQQGTFGYMWNAWNTARANGSVNNGNFAGTVNSWSAELQTQANSLFDANSDGKDHKYTAFYEVSNWEGSTAPTEELVPYYKVNWAGNTYSTANSGNLYPQAEKPATGMSSSAPLTGSDSDSSGELTTKDYRGWHQFVLNAYAANTVLEEEPYRSYITDNEWWTICPEFDITYNEAAILFGTWQGVTSQSPSTFPFVSKLKYVIRDYSTPKIQLNFSKNFTKFVEDRPTDNTEARFDLGKHGYTDDNGVLIEAAPTGDAPDADYVVMKSGVPYLIKPSFAPGSSRQFRIFKTEADLNRFLNANTESNVIAFASESLYNKLHTIASGDEQMADVKAGTYTVPVFVSESEGEGLERESLELDGENNPKAYKIADINYYKSTEWAYTFVGSFYKSFLPHYSYFLGWDSEKSCAKFYYHNGNFETIDNEMRWANGTGVIVPIKISELTVTGDEEYPYAFPYSVTPASGKVPALWDLTDKFVDDSFKTAGGSVSPAKAFDMVFDAPDVIYNNSEATGIANVNTSGNLVEKTVYSMNGQKIGTSLRGLKKGVYVVNGKKYVVK